MSDYRVAMVYTVYQNSETVSRNSKAFGINFATPLRNLPGGLNLCWSHYVTLLKVKDQDERKFYELEATIANWSVRELKRQINSALYERLSLSRDKEGIRKLAEQGQLLERPTDILKGRLCWSF